MSTLLRELFGPELVAGAVAGAAGLVVCLAIGWISKRRRDEPVALAGLVLSLAVLAVIISTAARPASGLAWLGIGSLAIGGFLVTRLPTWGGLTGLVVALPGAWLISGEMAMEDVAWARWFLFGYLLVAALLFGLFVSEGIRSRWASMLVAVTSGGILLSVPDTEQAIVLFGAALPMALLSVPSSPVRYGLPGAFAVVGLLGWVIAEGGVGRPPSIIGASACLGLVIVDPLAKATSREHRTLLDRVPLGWVGLATIFLFQVALVILIARVAGISQSMAIASTSAAGFLIGAFLVLR